jgi:hypothetical protein
MPAGWGYDQAKRHTRRHRASDIGSTFLAKPKFYSGPALAHVIPSLIRRCWNVANYLLRATTQAATTANASPRLRKRREDV